MNENTFTCFLASAKHGSFSRAAEELFLTRQAVSRQVLSLEKELGFPLFIRRAGSLELTQQGKIMQECFAVFDVKFKEALAKIRELDDSEQQSLTIGCPEGVEVGEYLNPIISLLYGQGCKTTITRFPLHRLEEVIREGSFDVTLTFIPLSDPDSLGLCRAELGRYQMMLVAAKSHPLNRPGATAADFAGSPHITWQKVGQSQQDAIFHCLEHCRKLGYEPGEITVFPDMESADTAVQCGLGVCICSAVNSMASSKWCAAFPLGGEEKLLYYWPKDSKKPALNRFISAFYSL